MNNKKYWVWLSNLNGFGHQRITQLLAEFKTPEAIYNLSSAEINNLENLSDKLKLVLKNKNLDYAEGIIRDCEMKGIDIITYGDDYYPKRLSYIYNPPLILYKKGKNFDYDNLASLAIVGTRTATPYGCKVASDFAKDLSLNGITIISGMASGIDAEAHRGALKAGKPTIAVLGSGVDVIYPSENKELYEYIVNYGAIISEYPPGTKAYKTNFPARNRIISGITEATLVVEADLKSGSLITADLANDQGKDVFAIPNNINVEKARGTNQIIKEFAHMVTCVSDIVEFYLSKYPEQLYVNKPENTVADNEYIKNLENLSADEKILVNNMSTSPKYIDELVRKTGFSAGKIAALITVLSIKDIVYSVPGNSHALKY